MYSLLCSWRISLLYFNMKQCLWRATFYIFLFEQVSFVMHHLDVYGVVGRITQGVFLFVCILCKSSYLPLLSGFWTYWHFQWVVSLVSSLTFGRILWIYFLSHFQFLSAFPSLLMLSYNFRFVFFFNMVIFFLFFFHRKYCPNTDTGNSLRSVLVLSLCTLLDQSILVTFSPWNYLVLILPCSLCKSIFFLARMNKDLEAVHQSLFNAEDVQMGKQTLFFSKLMFNIYRLTTLL